MSPKIAGIFKVCESVNRSLNGCGHDHEELVKVDEVGVEDGDVVGRRVTHVPQLLHKLLLGNSVVDVGALAARRHIQHASLLGVPEIVPNIPKLLHFVGNHYYIKRKLNIMVKSHFLVLAKW